MELIFNQQTQRAVLRFNGADLTTLTLGQLAELEDQVRTVRAQALLAFVAACDECRKKAEAARDFGVESSEEDL